MSLNVNIELDSRFIAILVLYGAIISISVGDLRRFILCSLSIRNLIPDEIIPLIGQSFRIIRINGYSQQGLIMRSCRHFGICCIRVIAFRICPKIVFNPYTESNSPRIAVLITHIDMNITVMSGQVFKSICITTKVITGFILPGIRKLTGGMSCDRK